MRTFLFLNTKTTGSDTGKDRSVQLNTRLVTHNNFQDYHHLVRPDDFTIPAAVARIHGITDREATLQGITLAQALEDLVLQIEQADIVVGHHVESDIGIIIAEARRTDRLDLVATLTHPKFGLGGGRRAAICTQRLAADYLRFLGETPSLSDTKLPTVYRRLFQEKFVGAHNAMAAVVACQRVYHHLRQFQREKGVEFLGDIVCLED